jgi:hypothetical protein
VSSEDKTAWGNFLEKFSRGGGGKFSIFWKILHLCILYSKQTMLLENSKTDES